NKPSISNINSIPYVESWAEMNEAYEKTPAIAIDIAVAEKTDEAYIVLASFDWDDVGSWDSFEKHSKGEGHSELIQSNNCFVYSDIPVAICGVDDITVVIKNGKALVMKKGASPLVRDAVKLMK
ncbi:MAG: mannose-1-phosphate guanylyltransferase, partial [Treponema sp.]|nr:mannose-1-phosphate guanylyltransferase [Treponema sp.]